MEMEIETERDNERKSGRETDRGGGSVKKEKSTATAAIEGFFCFLVFFAFACVFPTPLYVNKTERDE